MARREADFLGSHRVNPGVAPGEAMDVPPQESPRVADPGPLGLAAFAGTTFFLSAVNAGWVSEGATAGVLGLAFFYGGLAQLLAGMWEFANKNTFGAVAFTSYGAFWLSFWYLVGHLPTTDVPAALGLYLLVWTIFTGYMTFGATRVSGAVLAVFALLTITFFFLCIGNWSSTTWVVRVGGWFGIFTALAAWYASFAGVTNSTFRRVVFPTFPR
jgi:succinate-acetate transporter protein